MYLVNGQPATTTHSPQSQTQISRHYARSLGLKVSTPVLFVSLSVAVSVNSSPTFLTHEPFAVHVVDDLPANILLGSDWLALCRAAASTGDTVFAAGTYESTFNKGLTISSEYHLSSFKLSWSFWHCSMSSEAGNISLLPLQRTRARAKAGAHISCVLRHTDRCRSSPLPLFIPLAYLQFF